MMVLAILCQVGRGVEAHKAARSEDKEKEKEARDDDASESESGDTGC
jgi:hypothetical protein